MEIFVCNGPSNKRDRKLSFEEVKLLDFSLEWANF
jgi:hypothetical protein